MWLLRGEVVLHGNEGNLTGFLPQKGCSYTTGWKGVTIPASFFLGYPQRFHEKARFYSCEFLQMFVHESERTRFSHEVSWTECSIVTRQNGWQRAAVCDVGSCEWLQLSRNPTHGQVFFQWYLFDVFVCLFNCWTSVHSIGNISISLSLFPEKGTISSLRTLQIIQPSIFTRKNHPNDNLILRWITAS